MQRKLSAIHQFAALLLFGSLFLASCNDSSNSANPENLYGGWTRTYTGTESYSAQLNLLKSGKFEWIMLDTLSTHTNSFAKIEVDGNQLRIFDDPDFAESGLYEWSVSEEMLTLEKLNDNYTARFTALSGNWSLKKTSEFEAVMGSWQKTVTEQGNTYRVKLSMDLEGVLKWEMIDIIPGHTNSLVSYVASGNTIVIYNDPECNGNGYFNYAVNGNELTCTYLKDQCPPRTQSFSGTWTRINE